MCIPPASGVALTPTSRWRKSPKTDEWSVALHGRILTLRQDATHLHYRATFPRKPRAQAPLTPPPSSPSSIVSELKAADEDDTDALVKHYLNLQPNLTSLYAQWSAADANFRKRAPKFTGIRILRQDAWEALVGFICSSNNNIARISQMVEKLCRHYGPLIGHIEGEAFYDFPQPEALMDPKVETHLRELGFGYRARYLYETAAIVADRGVHWLDSLRNPESPVLGKLQGDAGKMVEGGREGYRAAHEALLELQGVGPKVADCVCLMGLGWGEAVPVDTHGPSIYAVLFVLLIGIVWQIAQRDYKFGKGKHSSLTKATYDAVGNRFRSMWGKEAGWAHSVLFTADLRTFADRTAVKVEDTEEGVKVKVEIQSQEDGPLPVSAEVKEEVLAQGVKRALQGETVEELGDMMSRVKRRRRTRLS